MAKAFEKEVHQLGQEICKNYGLDSLIGKAIISLYLEPKEIALEDLVKISGYSLSTMSTKMKFLEKMGIIDKIKRPGSRKVYYYMQKDLRKILTLKLDFAINSEIVPVKTNLPKIIDKHKKKITSSKDERSKIMLKNIENYLKQMKEFEVLIKEFIEKMNKD